jgi:beta-phosphoglucomutase-like phosphatase (HAD superfamily)
MDYLMEEEIMMIRAVIFDLDGVIVDTAEHHYRSWKRLAEELGIPCSPERKDRVWQRN